MSIGCIDCKDSRSSCGTTMSSACVWFTGSFPKFINADDVQCTVNINDIFRWHGDAIDKLIDETDVKSLDPRCLGYDPSDITNKKLQDIQNLKICELKSTLDTLKLEVENSNIGTELITVDLKCMKPAASSCEVAPNTYSLISVLNVIIAKLCP